MEFFYLQDAKWLYEHGEAVWGTDSDSFVAVLANQNRAQLKLMFGEVNQKIINEK